MSDWSIFARWNERTVVVCRCIGTDPSYEVLVSDVYLRLEPSRCLPGSILHCLGPTSWLMTLENTVFIVSENDYTWSKVLNSHEH